EAGRLDGETSASDDYTTVLSIGGLEPDTEYRYAVEIDGRPYPASWTVRSMPEEGRPARFRIGFGGGAGYTPWHERIWTTIDQEDFTAFLMMGDNVYHDHPTRPDVQLYTYYRRQSRPEFRAFAAETPLFAIWDDHDFGENDSWGGPAIDEPDWKPSVWQVFKQNWANPSYGGGEERPGVWFDFAIGDVDFFMLDGRYYRTDPKIDRPSMLGPAQKAWLFDRLSESDATFKVIVSPVPWAPGAKGGMQMTPEGPQPGGLDTWDGFPEERDEIFSFLAANEIDGVVLLSADRHRSDAWRIEREDGYALYEFESSQLTNVHTHELMDGALFGYNEKNSFGRLTFDTQAEDPTVTYEIVSIDGEAVADITVPLSRLTHGD
ncbi:MAG: alkaline phosphatase D family protein, partial [Rhodothermales bacterium]